MKTIIRILILVIALGLQHLQGQFVLGSPDPQCPSGSQCVDFTVSCPGLDTVHGSLAYRGLGGTRTAVFFMGSGGASYWQQNYSLVSAFFNNLQSNGVTIVQVKMGWQRSHRGVQSGQVEMSANTATVLQWLSNPANGFSRTGARFMATGNSAGSAEVAYVLSNYGGGDYLDSAVLTSGPVFSDLNAACMNPAGFQGGYPDNPRNLIDGAYGFATNTGPCYRHDSNFSASWIANSNDTATNGVWVYPRTAITIIIGSKDATGAVYHAGKYAAKIGVAPVVAYWMGHAIQESPNGLAALSAALLQ